MPRFKDLKIKTKILFGSLLLILATVIFGILAYIYISRITDALFNITDNNIKSVEYATGVERFALASILEEKNYLLEEKDEVHQRAKDSVKELHLFLDKVVEVATTYKNDKLLEQTNKARASAQKYAEKYRAGVVELKNNKKAAEAMVDNGKAISDAVTKLLTLQVEGYSSAKKNGANETILDEFVQKYMLTTRIYAQSLRIMLEEKEELKYKNRTAHNKMEKMFPELKRLYNDLKKITSSETERTVIDAAQSATDMYRSAAMHWITNDDHLKAILAEMALLGKDVITQAQAAEEAGLKQLETARNSAQTLSSHASMVIIGTICIVIVLGVFTAVALATIIAKPVVKGVAFAQVVAGGELDQTLAVDQKDEIGQLATALNRMVEKLKAQIADADRKSQEAQAESVKVREAMRQAQTAKQQAEAGQKTIISAATRIQQVVEVITSASEQLSAQIEQSSRGAEEQSHRMSETATAMEEMNSTVLEVAKNASKAAESSDKAKQKAQDGADVVRRAVTSIDVVQKQALGLKDHMTTLGEQAQGIGAIMNVISDIADQTNLLALNAAIEAARAGEAGRGFAVVADEVRKLAEKTMAATKEVGAAIHAIQSGTGKNIEDVDVAVREINDATQLSDASGAALDEIVGLVEVATDEVRSIATASEEQSSASEEITRSIEDVDRISVETAEAMRQSSQAVTELAHQAQILKGLIETLHVGDTATLLAGNENTAVSLQ